MFLALYDPFAVDVPLKFDITHSPTSPTIQNVHAFLFLVSYYRHYIPNLASVATPLPGLTNKDTEIIWNEDCEAFQLLKKAVVQPLIMAYPMRDGPFVLSMDASDTGMDTTLEQEQGEDGRVVEVIAYAMDTLYVS